MPTDPDSGQIELVGDEIRYTSDAYSNWTIAVEQIRVIGEATNQDGPFLDDYFLCFATGPERWYQASCDAAGCDAFLAALGSRLGVTFDLKLMLSTDFASRVLWPVDLLELPMFQYEDVPSKNLVGRLFGLMHCRQTYSDEVRAYLNDPTLFEQ